MPFYEYVCVQCKQVVEVLRSIKELAPEELHDACGGELRQLFAAPAVIYQGSGFAKKDRRKGGSNRAK